MAVTSLLRRTFTLLTTNSVGECRGENRNHSEQPKPRLRPVRTRTRSANRRAHRNGRSFLPLRLRMSSGHVPAPNLKAHDVQGVEPRSPIPPDDPGTGQPCPPGRNGPGGLFLYPILPHASVADRERPDLLTVASVMAPPPTRSNPSLLSGLPEHLSASLFASTTRVALSADEVLFLAGDAGDGCYRVEEGLLKVTMVSRAGSERRRTYENRRTAALGVGGRGTRRFVEFSQPRRVRGLRQKTPGDLQIA